jgi:hypothetical protein
MIFVTGMALDGGHANTILQANHDLSYLLNYVIVLKVNFRGFPKDMVPITKEA